MVDAPVSGRVGLEGGRAVSCSRRERRHRGVRPLLDAMGRGVPPRPARRRPRDEVPQQPRHGMNFSPSPRPGDRQALRPRPGGDGHVPTSTGSRGSRAPHRQRSSAKLRRPFSCAELTDADRDAAGDERDVPAPLSRSARSLGRRRARRQAERGQELARWIGRDRTEITPARRRGAASDARPRHRADGFIGPPWSRCASAPRHRDRPRRRRHADRRPRSFRAPIDRLPPRGDRQPCRERFDAGRRVNLDGRSACSTAAGRRRCAADRGAPRHSSSIAVRHAAARALDETAPPAVAQLRHAKRVASAIDDEPGAAISMRPLARLPASSSGRHPNGALRLQQRLGPRAAAGATRMPGRPDATIWVTSRRTPSPSAPLPTSTASDGPAPSPRRAAISIAEIVRAAPRRPARRARRFSPRPDRGSVRPLAARLSVRAGRPLGVRAEGRSTR